MPKRTRTLNLGIALSTVALFACAPSSVVGPVAPKGAKTSAASSGGAAAEATTPAYILPKVVRSAAAHEGAGILLAELDGRRVAYVADEDDHVIRVIDVEDEALLSSFAIGGLPGQMVMLEDGRLVVANRDTAQVLVLRPGGNAKSPLAIDIRIDLPTEPVGLALSPNDEMLAVTSGWGRTVTLVSTRTFLTDAKIPVEREPRAITFSSDSKRVFVSHAVGKNLDVIEVAGSKKTKVDIGGVEELNPFMNDNRQQRFACQGFSLAKTESGRILAPHALVFPGERVVSDGYGGSEGRESEVFHVPVIDEDTGKPLPQTKILLSGFNQDSTRCALPRAATVGKSGLFVSCLGENTVNLYDADALNPHDVSVKKWVVPAGPTAIALDEAHDRAFVWSQFAHSLTTLALNEGSTKSIALSSMSFERKHADAKLERGREIFHNTKDFRISSDGRACASCHPEGRDDTLVWSSPKGPRQTPMLAGRLDGAAPFGWNGDAPDVSKHMIQTVKRLGGNGIEGEDKEALVAYISSMRAPPKAKTDKSDSIARGNEIFHSQQTACASCHGPGGDLPDGSQHDVKSRSNADQQAKFDTPSLRFVGGSAPYFHDGRYPDLKTLLVKSDGKMGNTKHLSSTDLADLEAYLETL